MPRPKLEPHLQRLLIDESIHIGSLFQVSSREGWFSSLYSPDLGAASVLNPACLYAYGEGESPEEAVFAARDKMWNGL